MARALVGIWIVLSVAALGGCGSGNEVDSLVGRTNRTGDKICDCYMLLLFPTREACLVETTISPSEEACLQDIYADYRAETHPTLSCVSAAYGRLNTCLAPLDCGDVAPIRACSDDFQSEIDRCPELPPSVADMVDACDINAWN